LPRILPEPPITITAAKHFALVGPWPPYRGGIARFTADLGRALRSRGHRVSGVSFSRQYPKILFPGRTQVEPDAPAGREPEVPALLDSISPSSWWKTAAYLRGLRADAIIFQYWMPFFAPAFGTISRRTVADDHQPVRLALVHNALPHERRLGDAALGRYFLRTCDGLVALSESVKRDLERLVPGAPVVRRSHPVYEQPGSLVAREEARDRLGIAHDAEVLLFFGFVRHYKGLDTLLEALPGVVERHPRLQLIVAGEFYEPEQLYRDRVQHLGLADHVRFENHYIPGDDVPLYFGATDLVVQPYRSATQSGVAQLSFGFGVPVLTTDVGGLAEAVPHGRAGLIVPPEDVEALSNAIVGYFEDEDLAARLRVGAGEQRLDSGWGPLCQSLEEFVTRTAVVP
jgi:D-inositol-3-phosphate glycosyltransferase